MYEIVKDIWWIFVFAVFLAVIYQLGRLGFFDKLRSSYKGTKLTFDRANWKKYFPGSAILMVVVFGVIVLSACSNIAIL